MIDLLKSVNDENGVVILFNNSKDKGQLGVYSSYSKKKAGDLVRLITAKLDGHGGGKPDLAFGGYSSISKVNDVASCLKEII